MMRLSGSVKLRCALGLGSSDGAAAGLPGFLRPSAWRRCRRSSAMKNHKLPEFARYCLGVIVAFVAALLACCIVRPLSK